MIRLNFLAPGLAEVILSGEQPAALDRSPLALHDLPLSREVQKVRLNVQ